MTENLPSPAFSQGTPTTSGLQSPVFSDDTAPLHVRPLSPAFSFTHTDLGTPAPQQPGLESLGRHQADLEVHHGGNFDKEVYFPSDPDKAPEVVQAIEEKELHKPAARVCGLSRRNFIILVLMTLIAVLGIALGVGLGFGLKKKQ